jgi:hypothetical protein
MRAVATKIVLFVMVCLGTSSPALAWGSATHALIAEQLNQKGPVLTLNQIYGSMGMDVFNYMFGSPYQAWLGNATHCDPLPVWNFAIFPTAKAQAFGFVSHNNLWGADFYAHHPGCPDGAGPYEGYIFEKAQLVETSTLAAYPILGELGLDPALQAELFRDLTEFGVDMLVKRSHPFIGQKMSTAALLRSPEFPLLLTAAYARGLSMEFGIPYLQAINIIRTEEANFRLITLLYGQALTLNEPAAIHLVSAQMANLAVTGLGLPVAVEDLVPIIEFSINQAVTKCEPDYAAEIASMVTSVRSAMLSHGIWY